MDEQLIRRVAEIGSRRYREEFLKPHLGNRNLYRRDWYSAYGFFLNHAFNRGRSDELSDRFRKAAFTVLDGYLKSHNSGARFATLQEWHAKGWLDESHCDSNKNRLSRELKGARAGNKHDIRMVLSSLRFIFGLGDHNVVNFVVAGVESGDVSHVHSSLDAIFAIGQKLASVFIRDVVDIYDLEPKIKPEDYRFLQPVDTWVRQMAYRLEVSSGSEGDKSPLGIEKALKIADDIASCCAKLGVSPVKLNQSLWCVPVRSLEILLEKLAE